MASVSVLGDVSTTTTLAVASCWTSDDVVLVEADPTGGSLAAWLDVPIAPSLSSIVAALHRSESAVGSERPANVAGDRRQIVDSMTRRARGGLRFVPCPFTAREAARAVTEASAAVVPLLIEGAGSVLFDLGRFATTATSGPLLGTDIVVAVHRQERASARAAAVRLERFAETVREVADRRRAIGATAPVIAIVGDRPFDRAEIVAHVGDAGVLDLLPLAEDPMSAAVLAGRPGVSERRLRRQPLLRDARVAASRLHELAMATTTPQLRTNEGSDVMR